MAANYLYPKDLSTETPLSPELVELWEEALISSRKRRNRALLFLLPAGFFVLGLVVVGFAYHTNLTWILILVFMLLVFFIWTPQEVSFDYTVSEDRRTARIQLKRKWASLNDLIGEFRSMIVESASEGLGGFLKVLTSPVWVIASLPLVSIYGVISFLNDVLWVKDYREFTEKILAEAEKPNRTHVRGSNVLPSAELAGDPPNPPSDEALEILDGKIRLLASGGLEMAGGMAFDAQSVFENMTIDGVNLTRADAGLLRVHYEGEDHAFFYNGRSWAKV